MKRIITFGEVMLRLSPPNYERLLQSPHFDATFGGGEANAAVALAALGQRVSHVTALPDNALGDACIAQLRGAGVDTSHIVRAPGRMGVYFLERGANQRPSRVIYDRTGSCMALAQPGDFPWPAIYEDADWLHLTGITPAISASAADLALDAVRAAKSARLTVSCDFSYRKNLWRWGKPPGEVMPEIVRHTDVLIAGPDDLLARLGAASPAALLAAFPNLDALVMTHRVAHSASHNGWSATLQDRSGTLASCSYDISHIVDRVGAGDAFGGGLIFGLRNLPTRKEALNFATALGCLKHSIPGDFCRITRDEVDALLRDGGSGHVQR